MHAAVGRSRLFCYIWFYLKQNEMNDLAKRALMPHEEIANIIEERIDPLEIGEFLRSLHQELCSRADLRLQEATDIQNEYHRKYQAVRYAFEQPPVQTPIKADKY